MSASDAGIVIYFLLYLFGLAMLADAVNRPTGAFRTGTKGAWIVALLVLGGFGGALYYWLIKRSHDV